MNQSNESSNNPSLEDKERPPQSPNSDVNEMMEALRFNPRPRLYFSPLRETNLEDGMCRPGTYQLPAQRYRQPGSACRDQSLFTTVSPFPVFRIGTAEIWPNLQFAISRDVSHQIQREMSRLNGSLHQLYPTAATGSSNDSHLKDVGEQADKGLEEKPETEDQDDKSNDQHQDNI